MDTGYRIGAVAKLTGISQLAPQRMHVEAFGRSTLVYHSGPRRDAMDQLEFVERILSGALEIDEDLRALALGRSRLDADDHSWLLPGSMIEQRSRVGWVQ